MKSWKIEAMMSEIILYIVNNYDDEWARDIEIILNKYLKANPEDKEWDVVEIEHYDENYDCWETCTCWWELSNIDKYCNQCWAKIKRID